MRRQASEIQKACVMRANVRPKGSSLRIIPIRYLRSRDIKLRYALSNRFNFSRTNILGSICIEGPFMFLLGKPLHLGPDSAIQFDGQLGEEECISH